jgi:hypothetical protein
MPIETALGWPGVKWHKITDLGFEDRSRCCPSVQACRPAQCSRGVDLRINEAALGGAVKVENGYKHGILTPLTWDIT